MLTADRLPLVRQGDPHAKPYLYVSAAIFALVALMHLARLFMGWPVQLGEQSVPMAASWAGLIIAGALSLWGLRAARSAGG